MATFSWRQVPEARCTAWNYRRVAGAVTNTDRVEFARELGHPRPGLWKLVDSFRGPARHTIDWFFHFAPELELQLDEEGHALTVLREGRPFVIVHIPHNGVRFHVGDSWYSRHYGVKQANRALVGRWQGEMVAGGTSFAWEFELVTDKHASRND